MKKYFLVILSSFFVGLAQHPINLGFLAWFSFIPILFFLDKIDSLKEYFYTGFIWGFVYHLTCIFWLSMNIGTNINIALLTMVLSVFVLTLNSIIIFLVLFIFKRYYIEKYIYFLPFIWVFVEYVKSYGALGFPWVAISNTQIDYLMLIQNAEIFGIYGISFWILCFNITFYNYIKSFNYYSILNKKMLFCILVFIVPWFSGLYLYKNVKINGNNRFKIGLVQPNIALKEKWSGNPQKNFNKLLDLSKKLQEQSNNIIVWPESALPAYFLQSNSHQISRIYKLLGDSTKLVTGTTMFVKDSLNNRVYNSIAYIDNKAKHNYYNKIQLVPMAEYVPWSDIIPFLSNLNLGQANFSKGDNYKIFEFNETKFGAVVCYESTFPWIFNNFIQNGAEFMIVATNDGWYETAPEPQQHAKQSIFRAIENRKPVLRCANTGISMIIDQKGNINKKIELNKTGIVSASIIPNTKKTFYNKYGHFLIQIMGLVLLILLIKSVVYKNEI